MAARILLDLTGQQFDDWTVLEKDTVSNQGHSRWLCRCSCGIERVVLGNNLKRGKTSSCGHAARTADGLWAEYTSEYDTWRQMLDRCENPRNRAYDDYGGRGIYVCQRWRVRFKNFLDDMGQRPISSYQLDREDNNGPYDLDNCRWVSAKVNSHNSTVVRLIEFNGDCLPIREWERKLGFRQGILNTRLRLGWTVERAITQKVRKSPTRNVVQQVEEVHLSDEDGRTTNINPRKRRPPSD